MNMIRNLCTVCRGATLLWRTGMVLGLWCYAAVAAAATESQVKAAFILNFTAYIEWPAAKRQTHWTLSCGC
ncbi:MAG: hypothetical protein U5L02_05475 [Rheinheimera sp.]|nr:hypothetical protein [Rheinheimera sp.]